MFDPEGEYPYLWNMRHMFESSSFNRSVDHLMKCYDPLMNLKDSKLTEELVDAIHLASRLEFVDTENIEPLYSLPNKGNHLRLDEESQSVPVRDILRSAEKTIDGLYFASTSKMI